MLLKADTLFSNQSHLFIRYAQFFHLMLFLLSKIVFYGVQKLNGKRVFRKIEIIYVQHFVFYVAQNEIQWTSSIQAVSWKCFPNYPIKNPESQALRYFGYSEIKIRVSSVSQLFSTCILEI